MLFPTIDFAIFFAIVLPLNWALMQRRALWKAFMLTASYVFYAWWDWRFCFLLMGSTLLNHTAALTVHRLDGERARKVALTFGILGNLAILCFFKYYGFFVLSLSNGLHGVGVDLPLPLLQIVLPVGISFFTFQGISYVMDVFRRQTRPATLVDVALLQAFFPHLVAGPIVRATELVPQFRTPRDASQVDAARAFWLIAMGLFKKVVVASVLATELVDRVFANPETFSAPEVLLGVYGYAVQIYADFSGYTDIAIGIALLLGFQFPQNFNRPYISQSLQEFWQRWHITLSRWLRDYLYVPLGGNRGSRFQTQRNLILTMLLGGLWHGAAWQFIVWGALHGGGMAIERALEPRRARHPATPARVVLRWFVTFHIVCLGWIFFRSESFERAFELLGRLFTGWGDVPALAPSVPVAWLLVLIIGSLLAQLAPPGLGLRLQAAFSEAGIVVQTALLVAALFAIDYLGPSGVAPFIYFQF